MTSRYCLITSMNRGVIAYYIIDFDNSVVIIISQDKIPTSCDPNELKIISKPRNVKKFEELLKLEEGKEAILQSAFSPEDQGFHQGDIIQIIKITPVSEEYYKKVLKVAKAREFELSKLKNDQSIEINEIQNSLREEITRLQKIAAQRIAKIKKEYEKKYEQIDKQFKLK
ncbi:MAG TPA: hypothetical protein VJI68_00540 [Candidatus Nanoarchaeia archaeon]|nr:hypothetical protein [Candidatus Nanoarchaeia archaeon]